MSVEFASLFLKNVYAAVDENRPYIEYVSMDVSGFQCVQSVKDPVAMTIMPLNANGEEGFDFDVWALKANHRITVTLLNPGSIKVRFPMKLLGKTMKWSSHDDKTLVVATHLGLFNGVSNKGVFETTWNVPLTTVSHLSLVHVLCTVMGTEKIRMAKLTAPIKKVVERQTSEALKTTFGAPELVVEKAAGGHGGGFAPVAGPAGGVIAPVAGPAGGVIAPVAGPAGGVIAPVAGPARGAIVIRLDEVDSDVEIVERMEDDPDVEWLMTEKFIPGRE